MQWCLQGVVAATSRVFSHPLKHIKRELAGAQGAHHEPAALSGRRSQKLRKMLRRDSLLRSRDYLGGNGLGGMCTEGFDQDFSGPVRN
jgi:hypothetical protein